MMSFLTKSKTALVTGATGFIGSALVDELISRDYRVIALTRPNSELRWLNVSKCEIIPVDFAHDREAIQNAVERADFVFHLAAQTRALKSADLIPVNCRLTRTLLEACRSASTTPTVVVASSLAAVGPSRNGIPVDEATTPCPVSYYGQSKLAVENLAREFADEVSVSIVRPPIVLGHRDSKGYELFKFVHRFRFHLVPTFQTYHFSAIHVDDLAKSFISVAENGTRVSTDSFVAGTYHPCHDETVTYAELGRMIGGALGIESIWTMPLPTPLVWLAAGLGELTGQLSSKPAFLNLDKAKEVVTGSWVCSNEKLKSDTGFGFDATFEQRLAQTVHWYRENGWLPAEPLEGDTGEAAHLRLR